MLRFLTLYSHSCDLCREEAEEQNRTGRSGAMTERVSNNSKPIYNALEMFQLWNWFNSLHTQEWGVAATLQVHSPVLHCFLAWVTCPMARKCIIFNQNATSNHLYLEMWSWTKEVVVGRSASMHLGPADRQRRDEHMQPTVKKKQLGPVDNRLSTVLKILPTTYLR